MDIVKPAGAALSVAGEDGATFVALALYLEQVGGQDTAWVGK